MSGDGKRSDCPRAQATAPIFDSTARHEDGHLHHVAEPGAGLLENGVERFEQLPRLSFEVAGQRFSGVVDLVDYH
jgi:hypothetical protein